MLHPDNAGGLGFESETGSNGIISNRHFISIGGNSIGMLVSTGALPSLSTTQTTPPAISSIALSKVEYWHKDHLGSLVSTTDQNGTVRARYEYDPFGKRRTASGQYDASGNVVVDWSNTTNSGDQRGYTGHEQLDDIGIIHMNGRIYDPMLGHFMQPDPLIQDPTNLQNFNRYGYCYNNPMTCTDPSGMNFFDDIADAITHDLHHLWNNQLFRTAASITAAIYLGPEGAAWGDWGVLGGLTESPIAQTAIAGFVSGTISSGNIKGGLQGAVTAEAFYAIGQNVTNYMDKADNITNSGRFAEAIALHGVVGCVSSEMVGGKCGPGALSAAFSKAMLPVTGPMANSDPVAGIIVSSVVGGTASVLGGGKFANGAETAAFGYIYNQLASHAGTLPGWGIRAGSGVALDGILASVGEFVSPLILALTPSSLADDSLYTYYHGTDGSQLSSLTNGLDAGAAASATRGGGPLGFYLTPDVQQALNYAQTSDGPQGGVVLRYTFDGTAQQTMIASGATLGNVTYGAGGQNSIQFVIPPSAFSIFNALMSTGHITMSPMVKLGGQ